MEKINLINEGFEDFGYVENLELHLKEENVRKVIYAFIVENEVLYIGYTGRNIYNVIKVISKYKSSAKETFIKLHNVLLEYKNVNILIKKFEDEKLLKAEKKNLISIYGKPKFNGRQ